MCARCACESARRSDSVLHFEKLLQLVGQGCAELLPGQHFASGPQLCVAHTAHDCVACLQQVWAACVCNHAEACLQGMRSEHIPDQLVGNILVSRCGKGADIEDCFQV